MAKVFEANANKQLDFDKVVGTTATALSTNVLTKDWVNSIIGEAGSDTRKHFREVVALMMPHYVLNGTDKVIACDYVAATDSNKLSKTIRQYRLSVDSEIVKPEGCATFVETEVEESKTEKVKLASGWEIEVPSRDAEGNVIKESKKVQLVPRKKSVWGYTKDVKVAIIKAIEYIEFEK